MALAPATKKSNHSDVDLSDSPLGKDCDDVSNADRVSLVSDPDAMCRFILERVGENMELVPAINETLQKMTRR